MIPLRRVLLASAALVLAGCASPQWQKPGTSLAAVKQALGAPTLVVPIDGGGERLLYSRQPAGQQVYHLDFDAQRRLVSVTQVLTEARFQALRDGVDTRATVLATFGPPALVERVARFDGDIWTYRLMENLTPRQAHVHLDPDGVVRRVMFTDEILGDFDPGR
ncbi:MAG: hypothetical protein WA917_05240 [Comamonas sp.]|nr:outer membrane protein assembly factor BamE [Comamonas sp.]